jgi:hypothetical protein
VFRFLDALWLSTHQHLSFVLYLTHRSPLASDSSLDAMPSRASLPIASLWMTAIVVLLLVNAPAFTDGTEWCRPESRSPHDWTCLDADSSFPTCCPPGSVCRSAVCVPIPSVSSDLAEPTSTDWYAPCFYPNGDLEPKDMPCSSQGGACCPGRWQCLSNGLCYNEFRYERHTCTDQAWGPSCPQVCDMQNSEHFFLL